MKRSREWNLLPRDRDDLARTLRIHGDRESTILSYRRTMWLLAGYYLNGMRRFDTFDPATQAIAPFYLDKEGNLEFQNQELLSAVDRATGRMASMDLRPKVERQGTSLRLIRDRAVSQVICDAAVSVNQLDQVGTTFCQLYSTLGSAGIMAHMRSVQGSLVADLEVIHPKEILPFPSIGTDISKKRGIMRQRIVPLEHLVEIFGNDVKKDSNLQKMEMWKIMHGDPLDDNRWGVNGSWGVSGARGVQYSDDMGTGNTSGMVTSQSMLEVVRVREIWLDGPAGTCSRHAVASGMWVGADEDLSSGTRYCPIGFASCIPTAGFHGIGLFELLFPIAREEERLLKSLFKNVRDIDRYGITVLPNGAFNERATTRDIGGCRVLNYSPDPGGDNFRPFTITPFNAGDMPGKTAQFAREIMQSINPVQDLIQEKGRVDSGPGLQFLDEQIQRAMTNPTRGIQQAFGQCWRSMCSEMARELLLDPGTLPVVHMTADLAGAVINMEDATLSFENNPVPNLKNLNFTIRETSPRSEVARKQEALELLKVQFHDPDSIKLMALEEGLDFAYWSTEDRSAFEQVTRNILSVYGDGQTPGEIVTTPQTSRPDFQLRILNAFMSGPHMEVADANVIDAFTDYREILVSYLGQTLPNSIPNPDDLAAFADPMGSQDPNAPPEQDQAPAPIPFPGRKTQNG